MNNILLNWKYLHKGVPKGHKSALDRNPEFSEIKKLLLFFRVLFISIFIR
jgi:hypothetical protein